MLGDFSFEVMNPEGYCGHLFLASYLLISMIVLLNLIIAILASTYTHLETEGIGLYLRSLINLQDYWRFHPTYNLFTLRVLPCNSVTLCLSIWIKRKKAPSLQCLLCYEKLLYFPAFCIALIFFLSIDLVSLPFTWFNLLYHLFKKKKVALFILSLFFFPLYAVLLICLDGVLISLKLWSRPALQISPSRTSLLMKRDLALVR